MVEFEEVLKDTIAELETLLGARSAVGEPITIDGATVVPLLSAGFGFGGGGGSGAPAADVPEGSGAGVGAGGGVKPVAVVIFDSAGVRVERIEGPSGLAQLGAALGEAMAGKTGRPGKPAKAAASTS